MHARLTILVIFILCVCCAQVQHGIFLGPHNLPKKHYQQTNKNIYDNPNRSPIIFSGGLSGGSLMFKKDNMKGEPFPCFSTTRNFYQGWINLLEIIPKISQPCFLLDIKPEFVNGTVRSREGLTVIPKDFGGSEGVTYLGSAPLGKKIGPYMLGFFNFLIENAGYKLGVDLRAANYDWRLGPKEFARPNGDYANLKSLVEDTYLKNNNKKVHLMGHSMGGPYLQTFLATFVSQEWKDRYIASMISLGGSFAGAPMTAIQMTAGTDFGVSIFDTGALRGIIRNLGGAGWMLPSPNDDVMIMTAARNYTSAQMKELFHDMGSPDTYAIYKSESEAGDKTKAPNVPVHCLYGVGTPTLTGAYFSSLNPDKENATRLIYKEGDQTVPLYSLTLCDDFAKKQDQQKYPVVVDRYRNVTHISIISDMIIFKRVLEIVTNK
ncbi:lecithin-cholesterol acyltransferase LCAT [Acrasis kona]|uniref:Lecithin-cholesterol acyltransferase LCAT n=1 Tax=Acrasis kona TaxID=1008807 RepID=A0AAW2YYN4_9EUKA